MRKVYIDQNRARELFGKGERIGWNDMKTGKRWITDNDQNTDDFEDIDLMVTGGRNYFRYFVEINQ